MTITRRSFLIGTGVVGGGLLIGFQLKDEAPFPHTRPESFQPNAWLQITPDGEVIFQLDKAEMGQGVVTSLPTILGEELDFDPQRMRIEMAGVHRGYADPVMRIQITGGSMSVATGWDPLRQAGATARALLIAAAAKTWGVDEAMCRTEDGVVIHKTNGQQLQYGELVATARTLKPPTKVGLKEEEDYRWVGKSLLRTDGVAKCRGQALFGMDVGLDGSLPGLLTAVVVRCPHFGGKVESYSDTTALAFPGVVDIFEIHSGIAVVAHGYWKARKAAEALEVTWDKGPLAGVDSAEIRRRQELELANGEPSDTSGHGDVSKAFAQASEVLEATYAAPLAHHSTLEPQNCTAIIRPDGAEVWAPTQSPSVLRLIFSHYSEVPQEQVEVHTTFMGGAFGRRGHVDFAAELGAIAKQLLGQPVKLIWSREDDLKHDFYRPATLHKLRAARDKNGAFSAWEHKLVSPSFVETIFPNLGAALPTWVPTKMSRAAGSKAKEWIKGVDPTMSDGAHIPYAIPNLEVGVHHFDIGVPKGFWRSVGHSHNAFVVESFIDELAHEAQEDPVTFRLAALKDHPRHRGVLRRAAKKADWGMPPRGRLQGVAVHESFGSVVAEIAEVSISGTDFQVERVVCVVDCGFVINPDLVKQQIEGAVLYGLSAALMDPITIQDGALVQSNFHDAPVLRIHQAPSIEVYLMDSHAPPSGVGEIGLPPIAPAVANALFHVTRQRLRELPLRLAQGSP